MFPWLANSRINHFKPQFEDTLEKNSLVKAQKEPYSRNWRASLNENLLPLVMEGQTLRKKTTLRKLINECLIALLLLEIFLVAVNKLSFS